MHTRPKTNHSRLLASRWGNSSNIAVITPSNPANWREHTKTWVCLKYQSQQSQSFWTQNKHPEKSRRQNNRTRDFRFEVISSVIKWGAQRHRCWSWTDYRCAIRAPQVSPAGCLAANKTQNYEDKIATQRWYESPIIVFLWIVIQINLWNQIIVLSLMEKWEQRCECVRECAT